MEPGFTQIIHPGLGPGSVSEVPESSLPTWYQCGWRLLAADEVPPEPPLTVPPPVTFAEVADPAPAEPETAAPAKEK